MVYGSQEDAVEYTSCFHHADGRCVTFSLRSHMGVSTVLYAPAKDSTSTEVVAFGALSIWLTWSLIYSNNLY